MRKLLSPFVRLLALLSLVICGRAVGARPNIVWIVGEDMGPEVGCYGDAQAITPNLDRLAAQGARYTRCFTHAPVSARGIAARTALRRHRAL